ncbi:response regulator [Pontibaca salina]|uniref:Response regulator n=1 Tax=Pontibaca salina TaxID=2795731 RepID=A0A934HIG8_9RHOB|nr:response regulator [Pontibaca salina]MBI6628773.1 response regulator [Pontibaca salina]
MIIGYIVIGILTGLLALVSALVSGASIWSALALYSLVGAIGMITVPLVRFAIGALESEPEAPSNKDVLDAEVEVIAPLSPPASEGEDLERHERPAPRVVESGESAPPFRILAVDDDPSVLELIPMIAATGGYSDLTTVANGKLALEALTSKNTVFDCLLFDINMPEIDGIELCARVRQIPTYRDTPVIMLTAMRDIKYMDRAFQAGATDYTTKPFDITELTDRLKFAEESITAQRRSSAMAETAGHRADVGHHRPFALPDKIRIDGNASLIELAAASNYVAQLSREQLSKVHVTAVKIDHIENIHAITRSKMFERILREVAGVVQSTLDGRLMAYTGNGVLLCISDITDLDPSLVEESVRSGLMGMTFTNRDNDLFQIAVSIGEPVMPIESKIKRSEITFDRAIIRAENRFYQKQHELMQDGAQKHQQ